VYLTEDVIMEISNISVPVSNLNWDSKELKPAESVATSAAVREVASETLSAKMTAMAEEEKSTVVKTPAEEITHAIDKVSAFFKITDTDLELRMDEEAGGEPVVSIFDGEDGSLLRQYPTEEMLEIARKITEQMLEFREALLHGGAAPSIKGLFTDTVV